MKFNTTRFGELEFDTQEFLQLPSGLFGFPECKRMVMFDHGPDSPFQWMQSVDQPELAFVVIDPLLLLADYPADKAAKNLPAVESMKDVAVAVIATVPPAPNPITVNLLAPVVFNAKTRLGCQVILNDPRYSTRHILAGDAEQPSKPEATPEQK